MAANIISADEIFKQFKQYSISEFFRKNSQMLGYSGKVRSLTTIVHEFSTNSLDACEEANILPEISVEVKELSENKYSVSVTDNGPGIPSNIVGKALATILAGTKFHRYLQQRGQQGIGATGCTLYSAITTGKPIHVRANTGRSGYECDVTLDIKSNKPLVTNMAKIDSEFRGTSVSGEFGDVKYEVSDHGVYEYIKRTALTNPHASIRFVDPEGKEYMFTRSVQEMPKRPKQIKPHPLGVGTNDLIEIAHASENRKITAFLVESFSRVTPSKIEELRALVTDVDLDSDPKNLNWADAEKLVKAFKQIKWIAPEMDSLSTIGKEQITLATQNILNPKFMAVVERRPRVFRGGIPFVVEACIAYGGNAGKEVDVEGASRSTILRFANKVPLLFDGSSCAITEAVNGVQWKRYGIGNFEEEPISVLVNVSSVYVPYSGVGKQAIAQEDEIVEEIKLAVMDCGRALQRHISGIKNMNLQESRYNTVMRYVKQMSNDLADITGSSSAEIEKSLNALIESRYRKALENQEAGEEPNPGSAATEEESED